MDGLSNFKKGKWSEFQALSNGIRMYPDLHHEFEGGMESRGRGLIRGSGGGGGLVNLRMCQG